jgi:uncharacterized repeat protein (TIGR01451 family)
MSLRTTLERACVLLCTLALASAAVAGQEAAEAPRPAKISVKAIAEVAVKTMQGGRETSHLQAADRVVPGDEVIYTLEIRNTTPAVEPPPTVDYPIPEHMRYVPDSAVGAGAAVTYSIDGGRSFARPEELFVVDADGKQRPATAEDYTHIRWQLKHLLKGNSVAFARFRAIVK